MEYFDIKGNNVVEGVVKLSGNKNEALPVIAASLLCDGKVRLYNVPDILDVRVMLEIVDDLGASVTRIDKNTVEINSAGFSPKPLNRDMCGKVRTSILFAGPLLARANLVTLPPPGGDIIGRRRVDTHFMGFKQLGALYTSDNNGYKISATQLVGAEVFLDEASVTGTENILMAAVCAKGKTTLTNAATEPHVQGLCRFLNKMGAKISGIGTNVIHVQGVSSLKGCEYKISPDYIEAASYISLAAMTGGELLIKDFTVAGYRAVTNTFSKIGITVEHRGGDVFVPSHSRLTTVKDMNNAIPKIDDGPWPSFPSDLMSIAIVAATQAEGTVLFFEKMFESRLFFVDRLISMGAQIVLCDPHRVVVSGSSQLFGAKLDSPDIRAGMALLMAAVTAKGRSRIYNITQIDRGYESIEDKLRGIGVDIERKNMVT